MKRFIATFVCDVRLQWRNGFYAVGAVVCALVSAVLGPLDTADFGFALSTFTIGNLLTTTFFFVAAMVFFEKDEGTLLARSVSPLRLGEYLSSKVLSLAMLATVEVGVAAAIVYDGPIAWAPFLAGTLGTCVVFTLLGFIMVMRYDSITDFLIPGMGALIVLQIPLMGSLGFYESPFLLLFPISGPLMLLDGGAGESPSFAVWAFGAALFGVWIVLLVRLARSEFSAFVVHGAGAPR